MAIPNKYMLKEDSLMAIELFMENLGIGTLIIDNKEVISNINHNRNNGLTLLMAYLGSNFLENHKICGYFNFQINGQDDALMVWYRQNMDHADVSLLLSRIIFNLLTLLEYSFDGIWVLDQNGKIIYINNAGRINCGAKPKDVFGQSVLNVIREGYIDYSAALDAIDQKATVSKQMLTRPGKKYYITSAPVFEENNDVYQVITNVRDITEFQKTISELQNSQIVCEEKLNQLNICNLYNVDLIIRDKKMRNLYEKAARIAKSDCNVLITGDTGVGKDVLARYIHRVDTGREGPFLPVNCAAIPDTLFESEFFGHEKGAFTDAKKSKPGLFELAEKGTLFLDEIAEIPMDFQAKLLRAIQEKEVTRVGGTKPIKCEFRLISATNKDLERLVTAGMFRDDLYYRLNVVPLYVPPLIERKGDLELFIIRFLEKYNKRYNTKKTLSRAAFNQLLSYHWPGNVRELENVIERTVLLTNGNIITEEFLPSNILTKGVNSGTLINTTMNLQEAIEHTEKEVIKIAIKKHKSLRQAARVLGIHCSTLSRKVKKYNLI